MRADQRYRWPGGHGGTEQTVAEPVRHVGRERRRDTQAKQTPGKRGYRIPATR